MSTALDRAIVAVLGPIVAVPPERTLKLVGLEGLADYLLDWERQPTDHLGYFVVIPEPARIPWRYYAYTREEFWVRALALLPAAARDKVQLAPHVAELIPDDPNLPRLLTPKSIEELTAFRFHFNIHETTATTAIRATGARPPTPAVTDEGGVFAYSLEPKPKRSPEAAGSPDDLLLDRPALAAPRRRKFSARPAMDGEGGSFDAADAGPGDGEPKFLSRRAKPRKPAKPGPARFPENVPVTRTPHLDIGDNEPLAPKETHLVQVYLDTTAARSGETSDDVTLLAPATQTEFALEVWLVASPHFIVSGKNRAVLTLSRDEPRSQTVKFKLKVTDAKAAGVPTVTAYFSHDGGPAGRVTRNPRIAGAPAPRAKNAPRGVKFIEPKGPARVQVPAVPKPADLFVTITDSMRDGIAYNVRVSSPHLEKYKDSVTGEWRLPQITSKYVGDLFQLFTADGIPPEQRIAELRGAGQKLFEGAPKLFRDAYWALVDQNTPPATIRIHSEEPYIPWELMVPIRGFQRRRPLGVEAAVARWVEGDHLPPPQAVPVQDAQVFAPDYQDEKKLEHAASEADFVAKKFTGALIKPATFTGLDQAMKKAKPGLVHFVCHGVADAPGTQAVYFADNTPLSAIALSGMDSVAKACEAGKPFVFLNACEIGRPTPVLVGVGGFALEFLRLGASAVIAPLWSVEDGAAHEIAEKFYKTILARPERPFAEIVSEIRAQAYISGQDTFAAYSFYGDPFARRVTA